MKNTYLLIIALISTSCAYKPRLLTNNEGVFLDSEACFVLGEGVVNRQEIYYIVDNGLQGFHGNQKLSFYYYLNHFLKILNSSCDDYITYEILSVKSNDLYYSDTAVVAEGFKLYIAIDFIKNGVTVDQRTFEIQDRVPLYSAYTATKKRIDKNMLSLMKDVFAELSRRVIETGQSL